MQDSVAAAWLKRAEHLLEGRPESFADTVAPTATWRSRTLMPPGRGAISPRALGAVDRALRIADGSGDREPPRLGA